MKLKSKITKFYKGLSKRQKLIWLAVLVFLVFMIFRRKTTATASARIAAQQLPYRTFDPQKVYKMLMLTDASAWEARCIAASIEGLDTVQLVVPMGETFAGDFSRYVNFADIAAKNGLNIVLKTWVRITPNILGNFGESETMTGPGGEKILNTAYTLSFASSKWDLVYNWYRQAKEAFQPFQDAGYIVAHFPACSDTQEWVYPLPMFGDYSAIETAKSNGNNLARNMAYSTYQTEQLREKLHAIADIFTGWNNGFDAGSFYYDFHKWAGSYNFERIADHPQIKFIKNNPMNDSESIQFNAAICYDWKRRNNKYFSAEYTNSPANTEVQVLADRHGAMINNGCNLLSFAFHAPDGYGGGDAFQKLKEVKGKLIESGLWNSPVKVPDRSGEFTYSFADIVNNGHSAIVSSFNTNANRLAHLTA